MEMSGIIKIENHGRTTRVFVSGIDISRAIYGITFEQPKEDISDPMITVSINICELLGVLSEVTPEQWHIAKDNLEPYLIGYRKSKDVG